LAAQSRVTLSAANASVGFPENWRKVAVRSIARGDPRQDRPATIPAGLDIEVEAFLVDASNGHRRPWRGFSCKPSLL